MKKKIYKKNDILFIKAEDNKHVFIIDDCYSYLTINASLRWENGFIILDDGVVEKQEIGCVIANENNFKTSIHKNGCFWDNRTCNLKFNNEFTREDNLAYDGNQNKLSGVQYIDKFDKWVVTIIRNFKFILIGLYDSFEEACESYYEILMFKENEYLKIFGENYNINTCLKRKESDFYSKYFQSIDGICFGFPEWYTTEQRNKLSNDLIESRKDLYIYELPKTSGDKHSKNVQMKLQTLATYIINSEIESDDNIISESRQKKIEANEVMFSEFKYVDM